LNYWLLIIPRAVPIVSILVLLPLAYKNVNWGDYDLFGKLTLKEFSTSFLFNCYLYGYSDWVDRFSTVTNPPGAKPPIKAKTH
jgi:hypothetical protein